jgi:hypothetical protein
MAKTDYIVLEIAGIRADIDPTGQVPTVSYALEDEDDFEQKKSAESFDIELPATLVNDQIHNSFHDHSVMDTSPGQQYETFKHCRYIANGEEILIGKYLQQKAKTRNFRPTAYLGKIYGLNGDWVIELKEKNLLDFLNPNPHTYTEATIRASWAYDGRNENLDYVYAPARYRRPFGNNDADSDMMITALSPTCARPSALIGSLTGDSKARDTGSFPILWIAIITGAAFYHGRGAALISSIPAGGRG